MSTLLRQHAEQQFAEELHELKKNETNPIPENWEMSPQSVVTYLMGGKLKNGFEVSPKYIGNRRLMEIAVATLVTDRALLLYGLPGTAKSWVSEHMAAAISGDSTLIVQVSREQPAPAKRRYATDGTMLACWPKVPARALWCRHQS